MIGQQFHRLFVLRHQKQLALLGLEPLLLKRQEYTLGTKLVVKMLLRTGCITFLTDNLASEFYFRTSLKKTTDPLQSV